MNVKKTVRHSKEADIIIFLEKNKTQQAPIKLSKAEVIFGVEKFCEVQSEIIKLANNQQDYDLAIERIVLFRKALQK